MNATVSRRRRRHEILTDSPMSTNDSVPVLKMTNGETHFPADQKEMESIRSRLGSEEKTPLSRKIDTNFPSNKADSSDELIPCNQKFLMDMLYSNQAVASRKAESDEGSDVSPPVDASVRSPGSVNVKALAERLQNAPLVSPDAKSFPSEPGDHLSSNLPTAESLPSVMKKDSDVMWEKLMAQENHVSWLTFLLFLYQAISA